MIDGQPDPNAPIKLEGNNLDAPQVNPDVQALITELSNKREALMAQNSQSVGLDNMNKQLEALTQLVAQGGKKEQKGPQSSWDNLDRDGVHRVLATELAKIGGVVESEDGTETATNLDANVTAKAIRELVEKTIKDQLGSYAQGVERKEEASTAYGAVRSDLVDMYGAGLNKGQPLYNKAHEIYSSLQQRYGEGTVSGSPEYERIAVLQAAAELGIPSSTAQQVVSPRAVGLQPPVPGVGTQQSTSVAGGAGQRARAALQAGNIEDYTKALSNEMFADLG